MNKDTQPADFFVVGGTLPFDNPSYVQRPADQTLGQLTQAGEFCYVLAGRQMGKSSLMNRTARHLQEQNTRTVIIDLTQIGTREVLINQWYLSLLTEIEYELDLSINPEAWWTEHTALSSTQRFISFLRDVVLTEIEDQVVIFIDEIDATFNLDFTDDFFAAIRAIYNARDREPRFNRLSFVLLGVATPSDLIQGHTSTPFNIGHSIDLPEFSRQDAQPLQRGLEQVYPQQGQAIFDRIFYWTSGHPYLTQKLCHQATLEPTDEPWTDARIDRLVHKLFLAESDYQDDHLQHIRDKIYTSPKPDKLLAVYRKVHQEARIRENRRSRTQNLLKLFGLIKGENGFLRVHNEIYRQFFNQAWIKANMPVNWTRRYAILATVISLVVVTWLIVPPPQGVTLTIASSKTKAAWLDQAVTAFNGQNQTTASGRPIVVEVSHVLSGGSRNGILDEGLQPVVWSPGDQSWISEINTIWQQRYGKPLISPQIINHQNCQPTIYVPIGFAMWRPMAEALGWPDTPIGWDTIVDLAADPVGWGRYGHPEWGQFRFGHTHPSYSNSGLLSRVTFIYEIVGRDKPLKVTDIYQPAVMQAMAILEQSTTKYGSQTADLFALMVERGPSFVHAIAASEETTLRFNLQQQHELRFPEFFGAVDEVRSPLVFIFPRGGTIWADHPYCILDNADWVSAEQIDAAQRFQNYLQGRTQQKLALANRLRPRDSAIPLDAPFTLDNGTDPRMRPNPLPPPEADVNQAVIDLFLKIKRKATVMIVLDRSAKMQGEKIEAATRAIQSFLDRLQPDDKVGVLTFNQTIETLSEPERAGQVVERLEGQLQTLTTEDGAALYDVVCQATRAMTDLQAVDRAAGENRLYGIVLLSNGADSASGISQQVMFDTCLPTRAGVDGIKIFPIAFGQNDQEPVLRQIAQVTGGRMFTADPILLEDIYLKISAEQ